MEQVETKGKCYISLPITGYDLEEVRQRVNVGMEKVKELGYIPISPLDINPRSNAPYSELSGNCIAAILECDAVLFLSGWEDSKGCSLEYSAANIYDKLILFESSLV